MRIETYFVIDGRITIYKTPGARLLYGIDLADWLREAGTSLDRVEANVRGVEIDGDPFVEGTHVCAWIKGLDLAAGANNDCTFTFYGTDGKSTDARTLYFLKRPGSA